eukprot:scaffold111487_cov30-Phaeocystis_antarctica.AAC.1
MWRASATCMCDMSSAHALRVGMDCIRARRRRTRARGTSPRGEKLRAAAAVCWRRCSIPATGRPEV